MRLFSSTHCVAFEWMWRRHEGQWTMSLSLRVHVGQIRSSIFLLRLTWILNFGLVWWQTVQYHWNLVLTEKWNSLKREFYVTNTSIEGNGNSY